VKLAMVIIIIIIIIIITTCKTKPFTSSDPPNLLLVHDCSLDVCPAAKFHNDTISLTMIFAKLLTAKWACTTCLQKQKKIE
jgi:hypothetical protein